MSVALGSRYSSINSSTLIPGISTRISVFESRESGLKLFASMSGDRELSPLPPNRRPSELEDSASTSSIGRNSDASGMALPGQRDDEMEVESRYRGPSETMEGGSEDTGTLGTMEALEESLPSRKSLSNFISGRSQSFTKLGDLANVPMKNLAKPESAYSQKLRSLQARNRNLALQPSGGISKRSTSVLSPALVEAVRIAEFSACEDTESPTPPTLHPTERPASVGEPSPPRRPQHYHSRSRSASDLGDIELTQQDFRDNSGKDKDSGATDGKDPSTGQD